MSSSSHPTVLVTGATGSTGTEVVQALSASGSFRVLAGVRDVNKAQALAALPNVSCVKLDGDAATATAAFKGVDAVYLLTAPKQPLFEPWLQAAKAAGVRQVVYHSAAGSDPSGPVGIGREHSEHEARLRSDSGLHWTVLQPTFFHQNLEKFQQQSITHYDMYGGSAADGKFTSVDLRDVAAAAVEIFKQPEQHSGKVYLLTGEVTSEQAIAAELSAVAGRPIQYVSWPVEEHRQKLREWGLPDWLEEDQLALDMVKREGWLSSLSPDLQQIIGRPAITIKQYVQDRAVLWTKASN